MTVRILHGDARETLRTVPDESVHACITSPPYWGLRSYGGDPGMIGLEPTFDEHLDNIVAVFREVRRVLRKDGTLWLNYGDAYAGGGRGEGSGKQTTNVGSNLPPFRPDGFKPKDLMMMPARVAMALQADGWWLRSEIVWHKPNPMPESVTDRPTSAHEKMFLLSKKPRYFYDHVAVREDGIGTHAPGKNPCRRDTQGKDSGLIAFKERARNGNVWTIATHPYSGTHFATFPPALIEPCIKAGTSEKGVCANCGAPWVRETEKTLKTTPRNPTFAQHGTKHVAGQDSAGSNRHRDGHMPGLVNHFTTTGWRPSCGCDRGNDLIAGMDPVAAMILDPFAGSGTVGLVADRLGRDAILVEINPDYAEMARERISSDAPLLAEVS